MSETEITNIDEDAVGEVVTSNQDVVLSTAKSLQEATPPMLIAMAVQNGADIETISALMQLSRDWDADLARKAYAKAMSLFKANPPELSKTVAVNYQNKDGSYTQYEHEDLGEIADLISEKMSPHGLSFTWETNQIDGGQIEVTCVISHELGHSKCVMLKSSPDQSGGKNNIQAVGSSVKYLERYTLLAATGLAAKGVDDDGRNSEQRETLSPEQQAAILSLITKTGADKYKFFKWAKITDLSTVPATSYDVLINALNERDKREHNDNA